MGDAKAFIVAVTLIPSGWSVVLPSPLPGTATDVYCNCISWVKVPAVAVAAEMDMAGEAEPGARSAIDPLPEITAPPAPNVAFRLSV